MQVVKPETVDKLRYLFKLNVESGSGRSAAVPGYDVGGKTGTAEKVDHGRYSGDKRLNSFLAAFPMDDPQYVVLVVLDEPKPEKQGAAATAAANAAPTVAAVIRRAAALLGVKPHLGPEKSCHSRVELKSCIGVSPEPHNRSSRSMLLGDLATADLVIPAGAAALPIAGLAADSRAVGRGFLFAALPGSTTDGTRFVADAVKRGAVAVLAGKGTKVDPGTGIALILADDPRRALALMAARFHGPQPKKLVAVTGTSGKTSVAAFARQIFASAGEEAAIDRHARCGQPPLERLWQPDDARRDRPPRCARRGLSGRG